MENAAYIIQDWMLQKGDIVIPMNNITKHSMYMLLQPAPWFTNMQMHYGTYTKYSPGG